MIFQLEDKFISCIQLKIQSFLSFLFLILTRHYILKRVIFPAVKMAIQMWLKVFLYTISTRPFLLHGEIFQLKCNSVINKCCVCSYEKVRLKLISSNSMLHLKNDFQLKKIIKQKQCCFQSKIIMKFYTVKYLLPSLLLISYSLTDMLLMIN